jgi:hypothetical protein
VLLPPLLMRPFLAAAHPLLMMFWTPPHALAPALTCSPPQACTAACDGCSGARAQRCAHKSHIVASFSLKRPVLSSRRLQSGCAAHELQRMQLPSTRPLPPPHAPILLPHPNRSSSSALAPRAAFGATFTNEGSSVRFTR